MKLLRYDMSEHSKSVQFPARFVGASRDMLDMKTVIPSGGLLVRDIERNPTVSYYLTKLKKHIPDVSNVLLQLMDEGFVTDPTVNVQMQEIVLLFLQQT